EYKAHERGAKVVYVDPLYTSQRCPSPAPNWSGRSTRPSRP
ncbi:zinc ribbon domain-containing protein, partial [Pseudomonas fluorescens]